MSSFVASGGISLESIGLTLGLGLGVSFITVIAFGIAVMKRHTNIAPRCTARHPNTIWRPRRDMYGKRSKRNKKKKGKQEKKNDGGGNQLATSINNDNNDPTVANDGSQTDPNNDQKILSSSQPPTIIKRNSSFQDFKVPRIAANTAAKIVTGVDMSGMARSQESIKQMEEQEQQRDFVQNSMGQPVYVGRSKNSLVERQLSGGSSSGGASPNKKGAAASSPGNENLDELLAGVFTAPPPAADVGEPVLKDPEMGFSNDENDMSDVENELSDGDDYEPSDKLYSHPQDRGNPFLVSLFC